MISHKKAMQVIAKLKKALKSHYNHVLDKNVGFYDVVYSDREYSEEKLAVEFYFKSLEGDEDFIKIVKAFNELRPYEFVHDSGFVRVDNGISRYNVKADFYPNSGATGPMLCFEIFFDDYKKYLNAEK
jgi:hypothetical protein